MLNILFLLLVTMLSFASTKGAQQKSVDETKESIKALIKPLMMPQSKTTKKIKEGDFSVSGCEKQTINWSAVLMLQDTAGLTYKFKQHCDIEGTIHPAVLKPFPVELKLRKLKNFSLIKAMNKITSTLENKPIILLEVEQGELIGSSEKVKFTAEYKVRINPLSQDKPIDENLGGTMTITEINGKAVNIKEKILVQ